MPPILLLVLLDLIATWVITHKIEMSMWMLEDFLWLMVLGQIVLIVMFTWVVVRVRSGLRSVNHLSEEIRQRSIDDMQPLEVAGVPVEIEPLVTHTNDLLLRLDASLAAQRRFIGHAAHQLRTPLSGLRLESELMLARPLPDDARGPRHQGGQRPHDPPGPAIVGAGARRSQCPASRQLRARRPVRMGAVERGRVARLARRAMSWTWWRRTRRSGSMPIRCCWPSCWAT